MRRSGSEEIGSPSRVSITGAGGFSLPLSRTKERPISLVNSRAEALGYKARRSPGRFCRGAPNGFFGRDTRFCLLGQVSYPAIFMRRSPNLKTRPGNSVRPSGGKNVTHYKKLAGCRESDKPAIRRPEGAIRSLNDGNLPCCAE